MSQILPFLTANPWAAWLAFGVLSLVLSKRSQIDGWAEKHPRVAGVMKLLRSVGLDPWLFAQSATLIVKGRLPVKLQAAQIVAARGVEVTPEVKAEVKAQSVPPKPPSVPPLAAAMLGVLLAFSALPACSSSQTPQAQAAHARNYGRVAYSAATLGVNVVSQVSTAAMKAAQATEQAQKLEPIASQVNAGLHEARAALAAVRPWLEGGPAGSAEKEKLLEALDSVALAAGMLASVGVKVPPEVLQGVAAARSLLGGDS